jgi:hypothetical protein
LPSVAADLVATHQKGIAMTILREETLQVLLPGFTHHVDIGQPTDALISYDPSGSARMVLPGKEPMTGQWHLVADGYHVAWEGGPAGNWQIRHGVGRLTYIDPTGREAGTVTKIQPTSP